MPPRDFVKAREAKTAALVDNRPYYPNLIVLKSKDGSANGASSLAHDRESLVSTALSIIFHDSSPPSNLAESLQVKTITGGITNALYSISGFNPIQSYNTILIRVFGAEGMIDRDVETSAFAALSDAGVAPLYFGRFGNGRLEGWLDGFSPMVLMDLQIKVNAEKVAKEMAHLHSGFNVPEYLQEWHNHSEPGLWTQLFDWLDQAKKIDPQDGYKSKGDAGRAERLINLPKLEKEVIWLKKSVVPSDAQVAFCHNDLLPANIMKNGETGQIKLIDFEYGGINFVGFDIANHFNEFAGGPEKKTGEPDYSLFPDESRQKLFITAYVQASRSFTATNGSANNHASTEEEEISKLVKEVRAFVLVNHFYWGLWGVNQAAAEGTEDFDYLAYASHRFNRYFEEKEEL